MKIPFTINPNVFKVYQPSQTCLNLVPESRRTIKSEDKTWDESHPPKLTELCLLALVANFENRIILNELPCWEKNSLVEILPTDLPLPLVIQYIPDEIYWKRKVFDRWKDNSNHVRDYDFDWKRMYLERHTQEAIEAMTPEGFDLEVVDELCDMTAEYVKVLNLRELQIMQPTVTVDENDEFNIVPEPSDHIDMSAILERLYNLTELHIKFGLQNVGSDYKKSLFQFSLQDCMLLGKGISKSTSLQLLRIHSCNLDDDRLITMLHNMTENKSLQELHFPNCYVGDEGAIVIAKYLNNRTNIKIINLCNNKIKENGIASLAFAITQPKSSPLESLNLKFNTFGDSGCRFIASALIREKCLLKKLNISCCDLGEESGILIGEMLNRNSVLLELDISNNHLGESAGRAIQAALKNNQVIQAIDLRMTEIANDDLLNINDATFFNRIRSTKGEKGVQRELQLRRKREEEKRIRAEEEEALAAAKAAEEAEAAAKAAEAQAKKDDDD